MDRLGLCNIVAQASEIGYWLQPLQYILYRKYILYKMNVCGMNEIVICVALMQLTNSLLCPHMVVKSPLDAHFRSSVFFYIVWKYPYLNAFFMVQCCARMLKNEWNTKCLRWSAVLCWHDWPPYDVWSDRLIRNRPH